MTGRMAKKFRRETRRAWKQYWNTMCDLDFLNRLQLCWDLMRRYKWM